MPSRKDPEGANELRKHAKWGQIVAKSAIRFRAGLDQLCSFSLVKSIEELAKGYCGTGRDSRDTRSDSQPGGA